ncbi:MAG: hypothetical protein ACRDU8_05745 [Egibacteraceae bacterium]
MPTETDRDDAMLNAVLIALGALAMLDNIIFHWILESHRFKEGWAGSVYTEALPVAAGTVMVAVGVLRERRARRGK